jgi:hypothetical protein
VLNNTSQGGRVFFGRHDNFWYLERLPPTARKALCEAAFNWAAGWIYSRWRQGKRGFKTESDIAARIAEVGAEQITVIYAWLEGLGPLSSPDTEEPV